MNNLTALLAQHKTTILKKWFNCVLETYPADTSKFLRREKDRFANPVGHSILTGIEGIYDSLLQPEASGAVQEFLDHIIRVRAVQDFSPSQALEFLFRLKHVARDVLGKEILPDEMRGALLAFDARVDRLALLAFDVYMQCREKVCELRVNEVKNERAVAMRLVERMNRAAGSSETKEEPSEST